jgi:hypothetical protein
MITLWKHTMWYGLDKNKMIVILKRDWYLKAQYYTILNKVVDESVWPHLLQLHNKFTSIWHVVKKVRQHVLHLCIDFFSLYQIKFTIFLF